MGTLREGQRRRKASSSSLARLGLCLTASLFGVQLGQFQHPFLAHPEERAPAIDSFAVVFEALITPLKGRSILSSRDEAFSAIPA